MANKNVRIFGNVPYGEVVPAQDLSLPPESLSIVTGITITDPSLPPPTGTVLITETIPPETLPPVTQSKGTESIGPTGPTGTGPTGTGPTGTGPTGTGPTGTGTDFGTWEVTDPSVSPGKARFTDIKKITPYDIYFEWDAKSKKWYKILSTDPDPIGLEPGKFDGQIIALNRQEYLMKTSFV
jgi:hypothetical protein